MSAVGTEAREDKEHREATEADAITRGREDEEEKEVKEPAGLTRGRALCDDDERDVVIAVGVSSEGVKDGREDKVEGLLRESATLKEGRGTRDDFLDPKSPGLDGARVDLPFGLLTVIGYNGVFRVGIMGGTYSDMGAPSYQTPVEGTVDPTRSSDVKIMVAEREDQEYGCRNIIVMGPMAVEREAGDDQGDHVEG